MGFTNTWRESLHLVLTLNVKVMTSSTLGTGPIAVEGILLAQELMVVSCRVALGAVLLLDRVVPHPAVGALHHFWVVLSQESRIWPAGVLTPASGG